MAKENDAHMNDIAKQLAEMRSFISAELQSLLQRLSAKMDKHYDELSGQTRELAEAVGVHFEKTESRTDSLEYEQQVIQQRLDNLDVQAAETTFEINGLII